MLETSVSCQVGFNMIVRMPGDQSLPVYGDLSRPLPNVSGSIEQEEDPWRVRSGPQCIDGLKPARPMTVSPILDLGTAATRPAGVMGIHDQAASGPRQFT